MNFIFADQKYEVLGQFQGDAVVYSVTGEFVCKLPMDYIDATIESGNAVIYGSFKQSTMDSVR